MVSGELSDALLDQLSALSSEVFLPLIANNNLPMAGAPAAAVKGVADGMHKFVASGGRNGAGPPVFALTLTAAAVDQASSTFAPPQHLKLQPTPQPSLAAPALPRSACHGGPAEEPDGAAPAACQRRRANC